MVPIVMHHGLMGFGEIAVGPLRVSYFGRIGRAIADRGHPMIVSGVHPTAGITTRARQLKETILRQLDILGRPKDERVIVIAHSMGGLDARYMISKLGMEERVAALLTVTSPHRGSPYADWCVKNLGRIGTFRLLSGLGLDVQAANDLTTWNCKKFNKQVPDSPKVMYFSVSAARPWRLVPPFALHAYKVVYDAEGDNDSLVSVKSSTWGTHLGVWPADHWHTLNKRFVVEIKDPTGDITPYYLEALDKVLAACGDAEATPPVSRTRARAKAPSPAAVPKKSAASPRAANKRNSPAGSRKR
jgi:triacylglycerol lipase